MNPKPEPHRYQPGHKRIAGAGREKGTPNVVTRSIRQGIIDGLNAAGGREGVAAYVCRVALEDPKLGVQMMALVTPRQANIDVTRSEQMLVTIEDLDRSLIAAGLPVTRQVFGLDFRGEPVEDVTEAELAAAEDPPK